VKTKQKGMVTMGDGVHMRKQQWGAAFARARGTGGYQGWLFDGVRHGGRFGLKDQARFWVHHCKRQSEVMGRAVG
jgi:hypothetical protein